MKIYALFTLHETGWGTRAGIGEPEKAGETADDAAKQPADSFHPLGDRPSYALPEHSDALRPAR